MKPLGVIPAKAGTYEHRILRVLVGLRAWVPAFAGMTLAMERVRR